jgi:hypothetical protein
MAFRETEFLSPLARYLASYPCLGEDDRLELAPMGYLDVDAGDPAAPQGSAVIVTGGESARAADVLGNVEVESRVNLMLVLRRFTNDNDLRRGLGDFVINFRLWIDYEEAMRGTAAENPLLPRFGDDPSRESRECRGGTQTGVAVGMDGVDEYSLQLALRFVRVYKAKRKGILG